MKNVYSMISLWNAFFVAAYHVSRDDDYAVEWSCFCVGFAGSGLDWNYHCHSSYHFGKSMQKNEDPGEVSYFFNIIWAEASMSHCCIECSGSLFGVK